MLRHVRPCGPGGIGIDSFPRTPDDWAWTRGVFAAAYPPPLPAGVPGRGGAPRAWQRPLAPRPGGGPGHLARGTAPLAAPGRRRRRPGAARRADDRRAGGAAPQAARITSSSKSGKSCEKRQPPARRKPDEPVPVHPRGAGHLSCHRPLPDLAGATRRLQRLGGPRGLGQRPGRRGAERADQGDARAEPGHLRRATRPCRAAARRRPYLPAARGAVDARRRTRRLPPPTASPHHGRRPGSAPARNLVAGGCTATAPNRLWLGDITSVPTQEG